MCHTLSSQATWGDDETRRFYEDLVREQFALFFSLSTTISARVYSCAVVGAVAFVGDIAAVARHTARCARWSVCCYCCCCWRSLSLFDSRLDARLVRLVVENAIDRAGQGSMPASLEVADDDASASVVDSDDANPASYGLFVGCFDVARRCHSSSCSALLRIPVGVRHRFQIACLGTQCERR